jgi:hypothetical protein
MAVDHFDRHLSNIRFQAECCGKKNALRCARTSYIQSQACNVTNSHDYDFLRMTEL